MENFHYLLRRLQSGDYFSGSDGKNKNILYCRNLVLKAEAAIRRAMRSEDAKTNYEKKEFRPPSTDRKRSRLLYLYSRQDINRSTLYRPKNTFK